MLFSYFCTAFNRTESIKQTVGNTSTHIIGKLAGPNSRPVIFIKTPQIYLANQRSTNNEYINYTQSNSLIDNVPLLAHINNYLIKLIIPLNKTGQLPGPANFSNMPNFYFLLYLLLSIILIAVERIIRYYYKVKMIINGKSS